MMLTTLKGLHLPRLKKILRVTAALLLILLLILHLLPFAVIELAKHEFSKQGKGYELNIEDWFWSPFTTEFKIVDLVLNHPEKDRPKNKSELASFLIRLSPLSLLSGELDITDIRISGLQLGVNVEQIHGKNTKQNTLTIFGIHIPLQEDDSNPTATDEPVAVTSKDDPTPINIHNILISDSSLNWQINDSDPEQNNQGTIHFPKLQLGTFNNQSNQPMLIKGQVSFTEFSLGAVKNNWFQHPLNIQLNGQLLDLNIRPTWQGDINLSDLSLQLPNQTIVSFDELQLQNLKTINTPQVPFGMDLKSLSLNQVNIVKEELKLLSLGKFQVGNITLNPSGLNTDKIEYGNLNINIQRLKDGRLQGIESKTEEVKVNTSEIKKPETTELTKSNKQNTFIIDIAGIKQLDDTSAIIFHDASIQPTYSGRLRINELDINPIHIYTKDTTTKTTFKATFSLDEYNVFKLNSSFKIQHNADTGLSPEGDMTFNIQQLDTVAFNGYLAKAIGYHLIKGMLQLSGNVTINNNKLAGKSKVLLRNSHFEPEDKETIASVSKKISMPVDMALELLRDSNGNIELEIPIEGDLSEPGFGTGDIAEQISTLILQSAAIHYLTLGLQPFGLLLSIGAYAGSELMAIRLDALSYTNNEYQLNEQHILQLKNIAKIMKEKTSLELQVCPFVNKVEAEDLEDEWPKLASKRSANIKKWLAKKMDSKEQPLAARITLCTPQQSNKAEVILGF